MLVPRALVMDFLLHLQADVGAKEGTKENVEISGQDKVGHNALSSSNPAPVAHNRNDTHGADLSRHGHGRCTEHKADSART